MELLCDEVGRALRQYDPDAKDIVITDRIESDLMGLPAAIAISWKSGGDLHFGDFIVWKRAKNGVEQDILAALQNTEAPVPVPLTIAGATLDSEELVIAHAAGARPLANEMIDADMRWEISAMAFSYARTLARIHALDWTTVAPWMADPEALPEDIVDDQVESAMQRREQTAIGLEPDWQSFASRVLEWLEFRRPIEVSVCLCHGSFRPENVFVEGEDVRAVIGWSNASVTDASYDLAMLPIWLRETGLDREDAELFAQAAHGAYLQASPRGLGNLQYFAVSRPFDELLQRLTDSQSVEADELSKKRQTIERAMKLGGTVPWKNR